MGIKFRCHDCDRKLHVKAFLAGKRGVCPHCGAKVRIPRESQATGRGGPRADRVKDSAPAAANEGVTARAAATTRTAPATTRSTGDPVPQRRAAAVPGVAASSPGVDPIAEAADAVWYVRPPSGGQYGPADSEIMRRWLDEGRVSADSLVWREGWVDWKTADTVFYTLAQPAPILAEVAASDAAATPPQDAFEFVDHGPLRDRGKIDASSNRYGRHVAIVVMLSVVCVGLLIALFLVLRN